MAVVGLFPSRTHEWVCPAKVRNRDSRCPRCGRDLLAPSERSPHSFAKSPITSVSTLVTVTQNASYSSELTRLFPPPATQKWVGYVSNPQTFNTAGVLAFELLPEFTLPRAADGGPFVTPFLYRTVSGIRRAEPPALTTRPVVCGATTTDIFGSSRLSRESDCSLRS